MTSEERIRLYERFIREANSKFAGVGDGDGPWDVVAVDPQTGVIRPSRKVASFHTMDEAVAHAVKLFEVTRTSFGNDETR